MIDINVDNIITDNIELGKELIIKSNSSSIINEIINYFKKESDNDMELNHDIDGARTERILPGYSDIINSNNIKEFIYMHPNFYLESKIEGNRLHIISNGGNIGARDGSGFKLDYYVEDTSFMNKLQEIVIKYNISRGNGHEIHGNGLPTGYGDTITVIYDSGEKIYKYSNQSFNLTDRAQEAIYDAFHELANNHGYDFNTKGSNVEIYDDATKDFLQGTWTGKHFGDEYKVIINDEQIKVYCNNKLIDDTNYIIIDGIIKTNTIKSGVSKPKNEYDYEEFKSFSSLRKKNDISLVAYFTKNTYSTMELLIQK